VEGKAASAAGYDLGSGSATAGDSAVMVKRMDGQRMAGAAGIDGSD